MIKMHPDGAIIEVKELKRTYELGEVKVEALRGVNLTVKRGEFLVILGPSGSGKTTLLNCIGGIDTPTSGTIEVEGEDIAGFSEGKLAGYRRTSVGWVFQFFNLIPSLTAGENVALALEMAGDRKDMSRRSEEALDQVGLSDKDKMFPSQLSGGEQQRVAIARALVKRPKIVLADEPTGNLDRETSRVISKLMRKLNEREEITFLVVSHDISVTDPAKRVVDLRDGRLSDYGYGEKGDEMENGGRTDQV